MLEAERTVLKESTNTVDNFIGNICPPDDICDAWDILKSYLHTVVQQSLSGSEALASTPKCQSCDGDVKIESQETTYVCDKCFNHTYD